MFRNLSKIINVQKTASAGAGFTVFTVFTAFTSLPGCLSVSDPWVFQGEGYIYPTKKQSPSDIDNLPSEKHINEAIDQKWMTVFEDGTFRPHETLSLEAFSYVLYQALGDKLHKMPPNKESVHFPQGTKTSPQPGNQNALNPLSSIHPDRWSRQAIEALLASDLYAPMQSIEPENKIDKLQATAMVAKIATVLLQNLEKEQVNSGSKKSSATPWLFLDLHSRIQPLAAEHALTIGTFSSACPKLQLVSGHPALFNPETLITRKQVATLLVEARTCIDNQFSEAFVEKSSPIQNENQNENRNTASEPTFVSFETHCDVVINGGSLSGLAAALSSALAGQVTCLIEPLGYASGYWMSAAEPVQTSFSDTSKGIFEGAPLYLSWLENHLSSDCGTKRKCFSPEKLLELKINPSIKSLKSLFIFENSRVKSIETASHLITSVAIERKRPKDTSVSIPEKITFRSAARSPNKANSVFIETSPLGDFMVLSGKAWLQGLEAVDNNSLGADLCGSAFGFPLIVPAENLVSFESGRTLKKSFIFNGKLWTPSDLRSSLIQNAPNLRLSQDAKHEAHRYLFIENGNMYSRENVLLSREETTAQIPEWSGGVNERSLANARQTASKWLSFLEDVSGKTMALAGGFFPGGQKVAEWPRISSGRRSIGLGNYLLSQHQNHKAEKTEREDVLTELKPRETFYALQTCYYPENLNSIENMPKTVPLTLRSFTNRDAHNLLVAGPSLASTFQLNIALLGNEGQWKSGVIAASAAKVMLQKRQHAPELMQQHKAVSAEAKELWTALSSLK